MKQNLPLNQAILTVEQLDKEYPFVDLLLDAGFKHVFGRQKNKDILIAFLNQIIPDRTIVDLTYNHNEQYNLKIQEPVTIDLSESLSLFDDVRFIY